jgi:orotate phosphoribosyltransferase
MNYSNEFSKKLLQIKAIRINLQNFFVWASGINSPVYCDNRIALSHPQLRDMIVLSLLHILKDYDFEYVAGVATAGIPWGMLVADRVKKPFIYIRPEPKSHGRKNQIEGDLPPGKKVAIIEDLISTGGSSIKVVETLRKNNCEVVGVFSLFTYNLESARKNFEKISCQHKSISDFDVLIKEAVSLGYLDQNEYELIKDWKKDPENWYKKLNK